MICGVGDTSFTIALLVGVSIRGEVGLQNILAGADQTPAQAEPCPLKDFPQTEIGILTPSGRE